MKMIGEAGSVFGISAVWEEIHKMDTGHDLDSARILHHMLGFNDYNKVNYTEMDLENMEVIPHIRRASTR